MEKAEVTPEIVIIKRKRGGEEGHHGGVWKIAYADFMTAMMAFFLVMWLINAANEATRSQVASYFNPVKLTDNTAQRRGLNNEETKQPKMKVEQKKNPATEVVSDDKKHKDRANEKANKNKAVDKADQEAALFKDPIKNLDIIAGGKMAMKATLESKISNSELLVQDKVDEQQDPFSPKNWKVLNVDELKNVDVKKNAKIKHARKKVSVAKQQPINTPEFSKKVLAQKEPSRIEAAKPPIATSKKNSDGAKLKRKLLNKVTPVLPRKKKIKDARLAKLKSAINAARKSEIAAKGPKVSVSKTKEGILLSLTDGAEFGMFKIASAKPTKALVLFMEKVAKILKGQRGDLVVRGHTDGRPFHSENYDNWRLSTARAQMARFMLMRGGTLPERFVKIEGYADRQLKIKNNPLDPRNRRIEILLLDENR